MKINNCPFCSSENVENRTIEKPDKLPDGTPFKYKYEVLVCLDCDTITDVDKKNDTAYLAAHESAKKQYVDKICQDLSNKGWSMAYIERAFRLPQRTITRWKSQGCSASGMALMSLVGIMPWLAKIADHNYDQAIAAGEVIAQAGNLIVGAATSNDCTTTVKIYSSEKSLNIIAGIHKNQKSCAILSTEPQTDNIINTEYELLRA